ncbi:MAG TPA: hypothetical protein VJL89_01950 [Thermodesulfovibrionia bacterium]|nr:hypothetical protein [Thermodesulfovibrionia bacterium]
MNNQEKKALNNLTARSDEGRFVEMSDNYSEDGVDLTLIRWMLTLTPVERLKVLQNNVRSIIRLRNGRQEP